MGAYVNPPKGTKEDWLEEHGTEITADEVRVFDAFDVFNDQVLPVCLVQNPAFSAAAIAYEESLRDHYVDTPGDTRVKRWYLVPIEKLLDASDLADYWKGNKAAK